MSNGGFGRVHAGVHARTGDPLAFNSCMVKDARQSKAWKAEVSVDLWNGSL